MIEFTPVFDSKIHFHPIKQMGGDYMVCAAAHTSTDPEKAIKEADDKEAAYGLINYLIKHRHGTPFEHSAATFTVRAPIFVWREWHRHRIGFSYNEESGRYKVLEPVFYVPRQDRNMFKLNDWKPGRPKFLPIQSYDDSSAWCRLNENLIRSYKLAYKCYLENLSMGFDPGLARACLPVGIYSYCMVTCNPRSIMHFLSLRTGREDAKFVSYPLDEIEVAAQAVEEMFKTHWPLTWKAFEANGRVAP